MIDRLLDMGFKNEIDKIAAYLKDKNRQTLLFSATFSSEVKNIAQNFLKRNYHIVDTVGDDVEQTHAHVSQHIIATELSNQLELLAELINIEKNEDNNYKIMCFFPTAMQTAYAARFFELNGLKVLEIHSRKSQSYRTRVSDEFREGKQLILFSSDVTARGMDYPDVTKVIQIGWTSREQYIHRLGRTARLVCYYIYID